MSPTHPVSPSFPARIDDQKHAWLDSLDVDWISQAGSDTSRTSSLQQPGSDKHSTAPGSRNNTGPRFGSIRHPRDLSPSNSSNVLSERSANEINIFASRRGPSKLSSEIKLPGQLPSRGRLSGRSASSTSLGSVVHNTVQHKSKSVSPGKDRGEVDTPEWKRRLVYGALAYGEQPDLFAAPRLGLESIFSPPVDAEPTDVLAATHSSGENDETQEVRPAEENRQAMHGSAQQDTIPFDRSELAHDATMPSSPPIQQRHFDYSANFQDESSFEPHEQQLPEQPRPFTPRQGFDTPPEREAAIGSPEDGNGETDADEAHDADEHRDGSRQSVHRPNGTDTVSPDSSRLPNPPGNESRTVSGQSVLRNESFSAILISPQKGTNGDGAVFGPLELPPSDLRKRLENLRWNQMLLADGDGAGRATEQSVNLGGNSLNVDNTTEYERNGGFINFRRGGRSADGSFRERLLSPPLITDSSEMLPEESLQASTPKQFASVRVEQPAVTEHSPALPRAPNPSPEKRGSLSRGQQLLHPTGSPLKLFGPYDTYTNQTLMRRISQFEDQMSNGSRASADRSDYQHTPEASVIRTKAAAEAQQQQTSRHSSAQFGAGELNGYQFGHESSLVSETDMLPAEAPPVLSRPPLFTTLPSDEKQDALHIQRLRQSRGPQSSRPSTSEKWVELADTAASAGRLPAQPATPRRIAEVGLEGKRPRTSPSKDPTPKRRRTLHKSDVAFGAEKSQSNFDSAQLSHHTMQSIVGRKRRDAREGDDFQYADADVLAGRQILQPHTPSSSRRSSLQHERENGIHGHASHADSDGDKSSATHSTEANSAAWTENSFEKSPAPAVGPAADSARKPSIGTEDYMNEAQQIMAQLRGQGVRRVQSGLASVEESELEVPQGPEREADSSFQESTREPFSRPPSREGKQPISRVPRVQDDPELVARLKKYEERSDLDDLVSSTTRSINLAQDAIQAEKEVARAVQDTIGTFRSRTRLDEFDDISDPPNIRVSANPRQSESRSQEDNPSQGSQRSMSSGNLSTRSSIPTGSSRGSDTRRTIAPQTISHLIPDQVGNMVLDRDRNIWIKRRNGSSGAGGDNEVARGPPVHTILPSEGSEDDPFADITDLPVDWTTEMQNLKPPATTPGRAHVMGAVSGPSQVPQLPSLSRLASPRPGPGVARVEGDKSQVSVNGTDDNDTVVEHEISIDEGRVGRSTSSSKKRQLAISFSSPVASIIQDFVVEREEGGSANGDGGAAGAEGGADGVDSFVDESNPNVSSGTVRRGQRTVSIKFRNAPRSSSTGTAVRPRSTSRGASRSFSVAGHSFVPRPVSRIDEREEDDTGHSRHGLATGNHELSLVGECSELGRLAASESSADAANETRASQRQTSVSVLLSTPGPAARDAGNDEQMLAQYVGMMSLSPMSEFTIHPDRSMALEASYVLGDRHLATGDGSKRVLSQSLSGLVDRLAEVEPHEPYWEDLEELDVQGKRLESLHMLDEFCPRLVRLDATGNALRSLGGVPVSVRQLRVVDNQLSELTAWSRLCNLQYIDVSNNAIKTLSGLKGLVHLRSVKADNCSLESLDGLMGHDGLQSLRARGNQLAAVDFAGTQLQKLEELDLENNALSTVAHLDQLPALTTLNLRRNGLVAFSSEATGAQLPQVRTLNLSDNGLTTLDVRGLPQLRLLHADRNRLQRVRGFSKTPRLDSVSLREQALAGSERLDLSSLYQAYEIRKLYLSGNVLGRFAPPVDFLNLQLLELANCGLTGLPAAFGLAVPNLRKLNLNFNAVADVRPLRGIPRLKQLLVAGNRLGHAYATMRVLAGFAHLAEVDLRDNPVTQGFYYPRAAAQAAATTEPFTLPRADVWQDSAYSSRLDLATGMRRRVYEQVLGDVCGKLKQLDGLPVNRAIGEVQDAVWEALHAKGILAEGKAIEEGGETEEEENEEGGEPKEEENEESRWAVEDTFA